MYTEETIVRIAKRENNNKRKYLVVNALQGKHIPVSAEKSFAMFNALAEKVKTAYPNEKLLVVGFCETATAIGSAIAVYLDSYYMQTTREVIDGADYLFFSEIHSHATEQKLVKNDVEKVMGNIDRIVFAEDEVTTGNTILNIINILERNYGKTVQFSVASILNGMDKNSLEIYAERNIELHYLVKTDHTHYTEIAEKFVGDGKYYPCQTRKPEIVVKEYVVSGYINARCLTEGQSYQTVCDVLWQQINQIFRFHQKNILVLGTEEFMYPSLYVANELQKQDNTVRCHSTTRSPIAVSHEENYPLHERFTLKSLYDDDRTTYIYNLDKYDDVMIITDSRNKSHLGLYTLVNALAEKGNTEISVVRWCP